MRAFVDAEACTGCGLCPDTCPKVFEIEGEAAAVKIEIVPSEAEATCREAMENCPLDAISIET